MPNVIQGNPDSLLSFGEVPADGYEYEYPEGVDLDPESDMHNFIKNKILQNARASANIMQKSYPSWNKIDEKMTAYIPTTDKEDKVKEGDSRKPISVVFPYSYVIMETILSYLVSAFFPEPIFRYEGFSPEDTLGAIMLENVIQNNCNRNKVALNLHTMFRDITSYGMGIVTPGWREKHGKKIVQKQNGFFDRMSRFIRSDQEKAFEDAIIHEGNDLQNIDPYSYLPDPNVAVQDIQSGEFVGWVDETNIMSMLEEEQYDEDMFNVKYLRHVTNRKTSIYSSDPSRRTTKIGGTEKNNTDTSPVDIIWMYINIIPNEFGPKGGPYIGDSEYPEKWMFGLGSDSVVIMAKPLGLTHDDYPVSVSAPDFDGYSPVAFSRLEIEYGLQEILDWLLNSHVANVRKAINDMIIVDPYLVNINDIKDPGPGALIRLRRPAWGRGVDKVAQQLVVQDITRNNIGDAGFIMQMMNQVGGTDNPMQGNLRQGGPERLTKSEFQGTMAGAINRMERIAKVIGLMGMQDIGYFFAHHTQQFMSQEVYMKTTGRWQETLVNEFGNKIKNGRMKVTPWDILVDYDIQIRDGSVPGGNFSESWIQLYQILAQNPQLANQFEMVRIFKHIARGLGAKNVEDFERISKGVPTQTMEDGQVEQGVQAGNLIPFNR